MICSILQDRRKMTKKVVDNIKVHQNARIKAKLTSTYGVTYGSNSVSSNACFAELFTQLGRVKNKGYMQYVLFVDKEKNIFDYDALLNELNEIFSHVFKIRIYKTKYEKIWILDIKEKVKFEDNYTRYCAWMILYVILRSIDSEYFRTWKSAIKEDKNDKIPLNNWNDVIFYFYVYIMPGGHGINDTLRTLVRTFSRSVFHAAVKDYLDTLRVAFSEGSKIESEKFTMKRHGQTYAYIAVKEYVKRMKENG